MIIMILESIVLLYFIFASFIYLASLNRPLCDSVVPPQITDCLLTAVHCKIAPALKFTGAALCLIIVRMIYYRQLCHDLIIDASMFIILFFLLCSFFVRSDHAPLCESILSIILSFTLSGEHPQHSVISIALFVIIFAITYCVFSGKIWSKHIQLLRFFALGGIIFLAITNALFVETDGYVLFADGLIFQPTVLAIPLYLFSLLDPSSRDTSFHYFYNVACALAVFICFMVLNDGLLLLESVVLYFTSQSIYGRTLQDSLFSLCALLIAAKLLLISVFCWTGRSSDSSVMYAPVLQGDYPILLPLAVLILILALYGYLIPKTKSQQGFIYLAINSIVAYFVMESCCALISSDALDVLSDLVYSGNAINSALCFAPLFGLTAIPSQRRHKRLLEPNAARLNASEYQKGRRIHEPR